MNRYPYDEDLYRIKNDEAFDPRTGRKYHLEEIPEPDPGSGFMLGLIAGAIAIMFLTARTSPPPFNSVPIRWSSQTENGQVNPASLQHPRLVV